MLSGSRGTLQSSLVGQKVLTLGRKVSRNSNSTPGTLSSAFCDGNFFLTLKGAPDTHHLWPRRSQERRHFALACTQSACCPLPQFGVSPNWSLCLSQGLPWEWGGNRRAEGKVDHPRGDSRNYIMCLGEVTCFLTPQKINNNKKTPTTSVFLLLSAPFVLLLICLHFPLFRLSFYFFLKGWKKMATWYLCSQLTELPQHWGMENERDWRGEKTNGVPVPLRNKRMTFFFLSCFSKSVHKMKRGEEAKQGSAAPGKIVVCCSPCARCIIKPKIEQWTEGGWWGTGPSRRGQGCLL